MSAPNFNFQRRCVYVPDHEIEALCLGEYIGNNRSYPSREVADTETYGTLDIVFTQGYYEGGCIDIVNNEILLDELIGYSEYYASETKKQLAATISQMWGCPKTLVSSFLKGCDKRHYNYIEEVEKAIFDIYDAWQQRELVKANKEVDRLKRVYGLKELSCIGIASNGEGFYQEM